MLEGISYLFAGDHSRQGLAIGYCLCHDNDIWLHLLPLEAPALTPNPAEAALDFIRYVESPVPLNKFIEALNVVWREGHNAACSHDRFDPKTCDFSVATRVELLLCVSEHGLVRGLGAAVEVGPGEPLQLHAAVELAVPSEQVGQRVGVARSPVVAIAEGKYRVALCVGLCQQHSEVVGLTPAGKEKGGVQAVPELCAKLFCIVPLILMYIEGGDIHESADLLFVDASEPGVGVAHVHAGNAANQVDVLFTLGVKNEFLEPLNRVKGLFVVMGVEWKDVAPQGFDLVICLTAVRSGADGAEAPRHSRELMTSESEVHGSEDSLDAEKSNQYKSKALNHYKQHQISIKSLNSPLL